MGTLKPQSSGPLYSHTMTGTLAIDGWAVTFGTADVTAHPSMASAPTSYYLMWHYNCLWTVDG